MTATGAANDVRRLSADGVAQVVDLLETDFGASPRREAAEQHQFLLESLDRGDHERFSVWPVDAPLGLVYANAAGTVVPAGSPAAAPSLVDVLDRCDWRILIGSLDIGTALLEASGRGGSGPTGRTLFGRRVNAREQRFMSVRDAAVPGALGRPHGLRRGELGDLERITELAGRLHVEDRMGPPIGRSGRMAVRRRMHDTVTGGHSWVVERDGVVVAKVDVSLRSASRGAQIAGVYVDSEHRGQGIAAGAVAAIAADVLCQGLPVVTLHVRADNAQARAAYVRAGFVDRAGWILVLR